MFILIYLLWLKKVDTKYRSSRSQMLLKIGLLKNFVFTRKHLRWSVFSIIKTGVSYQGVRNVNFWKILQTYQMNDPLEVFSVSCWQQKSKTDDQGKYIPRFNRSFRSTLQNFKQFHHLRGIWHVFIYNRSPPICEIASIINCTSMNYLLRQKHD